MDTFQFRLNNGKNKLFPCLYCGSLVKVQLIVLSFLQIHHLWANTNCKRKLPSFRFGVIYAVFFFSFAKISQKKSFRNNWASKNWEKFTENQRVVMTGLRFV